MPGVVNIRSEVLGHLGQGLAILDTHGAILGIVEDGNPQAAIVVVATPLIALQVVF